MSVPDLAERLDSVRERIAAAVVRGGHGQTVRIVAVTKTFGAETVRAAWENGVRDVGENRVQEALRKMDAVELPVTWHLIGHLQRNKVAALNRFDLVHSLDSPRLADAVNVLGSQRGRPVEALLQVSIVGEETKGGYDVSGVAAEAKRLAGMSGIRLKGVMTMAPLEADDGLLRQVFQGARRARDLLAAAGHPATELSMGMSNDFEIAVEEGATIVRLGTVLFGAR
ncbi:MAG: YggS family pyridoxal phosphate-dependent enzyme [Gemmatimonadaceae bacterium]